METLSDRQNRVLQILRQPNFVLRQDPWSAVWTVGERNAWYSDFVRVCLKTKEASDLERLGFIKTVGKACTGKSIYSVA